jgi:hypothetical protein
MFSAASCRREEISRERPSRWTGRAPKWIAAESLPEDLRLLFPDRVIKGTVGLLLAAHLPMPRRCLPRAYIVRRRQPSSSVCQGASHHSTKQAPNRITSQGGLSSGCNLSSALSYCYVLNPIEGMVRCADLHFSSRFARGCAQHRTPSSPIPKDSGAGPE